jgi:hypothetical protein
MKKKRFKLNSLFQNHYYDMKNKRHKHKPRPAKFHNASFQNLERKWVWMSVWDFTVT